LFKSTQSQSLSETILVEQLQEEGKLDEQILKYPICFSFDGENAQLQYVYTAVLPLCKHKSIELQKFPGRGSLLFPANDVMKILLIV